MQEVPQLSQSPDETLYQHVRVNNFRTAAELASLMDVPRSGIDGRLMDLKLAGRITFGRQRRCNVTGDVALTWVVNTRRAQ